MKMRWAELSHCCQLLELGLLGVICLQVVNDAGHALIIVHSLSVIVDMRLIPPDSCYDPVGLPGDSASLDCLRRQFVIQANSLQDVEVPVGFAPYDYKKTVFRIEYCGFADDGNDLLRQESTPGR